MSLDCLIRYLPRRRCTARAVNLAIHADVRQKAGALEKALIRLAPSERRAGREWAITEIIATYRGQGHRSSRPLCRDEQAGLSIPDDIPALVEAFAQSLKPAIPFVALSEMTSFYERLLPEEQKKKDGIFYTPAGLGYALIDHAEAEGIDWARARILEPACGAGMLFLRLLSRKRAMIRNRSPKRQLQILKDSCLGLDTDPFAVWLCQAFVEILLHDLCEEAGCSCPELVRLGNFLAEPLEEGGFDLILANPPYGSIPLSPGLKARFGETIFGRANLYGLFLARAVELARKDGIIAMIVPTSLASGEYFKNLRRVLIRDTRPRCFDLVHERNNIYGKARQETMLVTFRKAQASGTCDHDQAPVFATEIDGPVSLWRGPMRKAGPMPRPSAQTPLSLTDCARLPVGSFRPPSDPSAPWFLPRQTADVALIAALGDHSAHLDDWGLTISTGPIAWERRKSEIHEKSVPGTVPLVWAAALSQRELHDHEVGGKPGSYLTTTPGDAKFMVRRPCVLLKRTSSKEQPRRLMASVVTAGFLARFGGAIAIENHVNIITHADPSAPRVSLEAVTAFFNSPIVDRIFRCQSGSNAVSAYEIRNLPLLTVSQINKIAALLANGAAEATIDEAIGAFYGESRLQQSEGPRKSGISAGLKS